MKITKKDVIWNYSATFLRIGSSAILLPLILREMSSETVGLWTVFITITAFSGLLDFGFNSSFTRNITYVFSGVDKLKANGFSNISDKNIVVDYGLLNGVITVMKWFYFRIAIVLLILLVTVGTYYIFVLLKDYKSDHLEVYISWAILCFINTYNVFTLYYDSLLQGKGLIKRSKQIIIVGQLSYLILAGVLILLNKGLIAIVSAQAVSVLLIRWLSYKTFFTIELKEKIQGSISHPTDEIFKAIYPNALKIGLTSLGGFLVVKSAVIIGSLYLSLAEIASYGITMQLTGVISSLGGIYIATYIPKIINLRVNNNISKIKNIYLKGIYILIMTYVLFGGIFVLFGNWALDLIGSKTSLITSGLLILVLILSFFETNLSIAGSILLTKNEVPFFKASILSGMSIVVGLFLTFNLTNLGLIVMIVVPLIVNISYQAWKWPYEVKKDLKISFIDLFNIK